MEAKHARNPRRAVVPVLLLSACSSSPAKPEPPQSDLVPGYTMLGNLFFSPTPQLDLVFIIDTSPSMGPKREKVSAQLPRMVAALMDPSTGELPSLRIAILDGDLGTSSVVTQGACAGRNAATVGVNGAMRMLGGAGCGVTDPTALWLQTATLSPANFTGDVVEVFSCLALGLGQSGCEYRQPLQALALAATRSTQPGLSEFLRQDAYLGLVIISDQDDCSAFPDPAMFAPELPGETPDLRCASRGHTCNRANLAYPTTESFTSLFAECGARTDTNCPTATDFSQPTSCTPLAEVKAIANQVKSLKPTDAQEKIIVTGIFGWPPHSRSGPPIYSYKIAPIPNPAYTPGAQAAPTLFDLWPVCYDPDHPPDHPDPATGYDAVAAGFGAKPGLRLSAFIDEFGDSGLKYSMCESDWTPATTAMVESPGGPLRLPVLCIDQRLADGDPNTPALDPDCIVELLYPEREALSPPACDGGVANPPCFATPASEQDYAKSLIPRCTDSASTGPCWEIRTDFAKCPSSGQYFMGRSSWLPNNYVPGGTKARIQCRVCPSQGPDRGSTPGCDR